MNGPKEAKRLSIPSKIKFGPLSLCIASGATEPKQQNSNLCKNGGSCRFQKEHQKVRKSALFGQVLYKSVLAQFPALFLESVETALSAHIHVLLLGLCGSIVKTQHYPAFCSVPSWGEFSSWAFNVISTCSLWVVVHSMQARHCCNDVLWYLPRKWP